MLIHEKTNIEFQDNLDVLLAHNPLFKFECLLSIGKQRGHYSDKLLKAMLSTTYDIKDRQLASDKALETAHCTPEGSEQQFQAYSDTFHHACGISDLEACVEQMFKIAPHTKDLRGFVDPRDVAITRVKNSKNHKLAIDLLCEISARFDDSSPRKLETIKAAQTHADAMYDLGDASACNLRIAMLYPHGHAGRHAALEHALGQADQIENPQSALKAICAIKEAVNPANPDNADPAVHAKAIARLEEMHNKISLLEKAKRSPDACLKAFPFLKEFVVS